MIRKFVTKIDKGIYNDTLLSPFCWSGIECSIWIPLVLVFLLHHTLPQR